MATHKEQHPGAAYRSGFEARVAGELAARGLDPAALYEPARIPFMRPPRRALYTPDFVLPNGIIIELKGRLDSADRIKHRLLKEQHPDLDIRFVFARHQNTIAKRSRTTYAKWADRLGIPWAGGTIPLAWLRSAPRRASLAALKALTERSHPAAADMEEAPVS